MYGVLLPFCFPSAYVSTLFIDDATAREKNIPHTAALKTWTHCAVAVTTHVLKQLR